MSEVAEAAGCKSFQEFLDTRQYSRRSIRSYELIFGKNFCCPGGLESTEVAPKLIAVFFYFFLLKANKTIS